MGADQSQYAQPQFMMPPGAPFMMGQMDPSMMMMGQMPFGGQQFMGGFRKSKNLHYISH
jgi:hypothetical protein